MIKAPEVFGFPNEGNTCYLNALLQATRSLWVLKEGLAPGTIGRALWDRYHTKPGKESTIICTLKPHVEKGKSVYDQSDPPKYLDLIGKSLRLEGNWDMTRNFAIRGVIIRPQCLTCNTVYVDTSRSNYGPNQQTLYYPLKRNMRNTEALLNHREEGYNEEQYCCVCKKITLHTGPTTMCHGPYVILSMNSPFVDQHSSVTMRTFTRKGETWTLIAVVVHKGRTQNSGHYVAYCEIPADPNHWRLLDDEIVTNIGLPDLDRILIPGEYHRVYMAMYRVDKQHQTTEEQPPHPATTEKPLPPPATAEKILPPPRFAFGTSTGESGASMVQRLMQKRGPGAGFEVAAEPKQVKPVEDEDAMDEESSSSIGGLIRRIRERMRV